VYDGDRVLGQASVTKAGRGAVLSPAMA